jgi:hypothetical protein
MALAATIAIVSLIAILAVTTLSLTTRLVQESALGLRDARLEASASYGLASVAPEWQAQGIGAIAVGSTVEVSVLNPGNGVAVGVAVTRIEAGTFWAVSTATAADGSVRRQNLVLRIRLPDADLLVAEDSTNVLSVGGVPVDSIAAEAAASLSPGATWFAADGIIHALGDLELTGGSATGVLIVEGKLTISGPLTYSGIIIAKNGLAVTSSASITGILRVRAVFTGPALVSPSPGTAQAVLSKGLTPRPVHGRAWGEMF